MTADAFWQVVDVQLAELEAAAGADDVLRILADDRNPYGPGVGSGDGFFAGSGGDGSVLAALLAAGWRVLWERAEYHWAAAAPDGSAVTYVEGDVYRGNHRPI